MLLLSGSVEVSGEDSLGHTALSGLGLAWVNTGPRERLLHPGKTPTDLIHIDPPKTHSYCKYFDTLTVSVLSHCVAYLNVNVNECFYAFKP